MKNLVPTFVQTTHGPKEPKTVPSRKKADTGNFHKPSPEDHLAKNWKAALFEPGTTNCKTRFLLGFRSDSRGN
jgi:hypothetical protein